MICQPASASAVPNQPVCQPYTRISASPTTIGDTEIGRSINTLSIPLPGNRKRASSSAMPTPNRVFSSTAEPATNAVSW